MIAEIIEEYNYPSKQKFKKIVKDKYPNISSKDIDDFYHDGFQAVERKNKSKSGKIVAFLPHERWNIDLLVMDKYQRYNQSYKYILFAIDIFSRYVFAQPLKSKSSADVIEAIENIFKSEQPLLIVSDSERSFLSEPFQMLLREYNIVHQTVPVGDHNTLGVIDRFAKTYRDIIQKQFIAKNSLNWITSLQRIIKIYNNTEHRTLKMSPNEALKDENFLEIYFQNQIYSAINLELPSNIKNKLETGDKVRVRKINKTFKKGTEPQFSNEVFTVKKAKGKKVELDNGKVLTIDEVVKVPSNSKTINNPVIKLNKQKRIERALNQLR